jgi:hypothetical protein|tara:strand:- start:684 stop:899 length:216 start_codon:yes stop_codon:yes gene_type:complete
MTSEIYSSKTGLYTIRFKSDIIHEGISAIEVSELLMNYKKSYENKKDSEWPLEPEHMRVEEFSGKFVLKKK